MAAEPALKSEEIAELIREVRERVRARYPESSACGIALPDLSPVLHARDAAQAKMAAIGTVNPRPPGPLNAAVQFAKRLVARALDWHVRGQAEFNRGVIAAIEAVLEALNDTNRALAALAHVAAAAESVKAVRWNEWRPAWERDLADLAGQAAGGVPAGAAAQEASDAAAHFAAWRAGWEHKLAEMEIDFLRNVAELHAAFQSRVMLLEESVRDQVKLQHSDFTAALERAAAEMQNNTERLIHSELRVLRQRLLTRAALAAPPQAVAAPALNDSAAQMERFRGSEDEVRERQRFYVPYFAECAEVLDLGCGRGEFLELMREAGVRARGIDSSAEAVAVCREKGLDAEVADLFVYVSGLQDESIDGVFSAQVVEHLPPGRLPEMVRLIARKLKPRGRVAIETPNPECLAVFASHFYLDPSHERPIPAQLLSFYLLEAGMGEIRIERRSPAIETMPSLAELPAAFREAFFGGLDYAALARKL